MQGFIHLSLHGRRPASSPKSFAALPPPRRRSPYPQSLSRMTGNDRKRSNPSGSHGGGGNKRKKVLGQCLRPRTRSLTHTQGNAWKQGYSITGIEAGFKGIFATCDRGKEGKCVSEMYGLLEDVCAALDRQISSRRIDMTVVCRKTLRTEERGGRRCRAKRRWRDRRYRGGSQERNGGTGRRGEEKER